MKIKITISRALLCLVIAFCVLSSGCATSNRYKMETNDVIAKGATGTVAVVPTDMSNTKMRLRLKHLYPAEQIKSGTTNYIVWVKPEGEGTYQNVGGIQVNNNLEAEYSTTIPFSNFYILVTPEKGNAVQKPTGPNVFEKRIIR